MIVKVRNSIKLTFVIAFTSLAILPWMTEDFATLFNNFSSRKSTPSDNFYSARIYSLNSDLLNLGNFYADNEAVENRKFEFLSLGEIFLRLSFKVFFSQATLHYLVMSWIILCLWIYLGFKIINTTRGIHSFSKSIILISIGYLFFFGNVNFLDSQYRFARIVSPQIHGLLWLFGILLIVKINLATSRPFVMTQRVALFVLLVCISLFTYPFLFLILAATAMILGMWLVKRMMHGQALTLFLLLLVPVTFLLNSYISRKSDERALDAAERHGLLETHVPGALYPTLLCTLIVLGIWLSSLRVKQSSRIQPVDFALLVSSIGVILASQSNVVTGESVQFSDHFNVFASLNFIIFLASRIQKIQFSKRNVNNLLKKASLASALMLLGGNTISQAFLGYTKEETLPFQTNVSSNTITIVDAIPDREYFPAFHDVKLVFDSSIFLYKFDNAELIDRLYVSTGCPTNFGVGDLASIVGYRVAPYEQKAARIRVLKKLPLLNSLAELEIRKLESIARIRREEISSELNVYLMKANVSNCLQAARRFDVDLIIFDEASFWFKRAIQENYNLKRFNSRGLWYLDLRT